MRGSGSATDSGICADSGYRRVDGLVVLDLVESPSVSRTSAVARTFGPAVSEEYSPVVLAGREVADAYPLVVVESDTARVSDLPVAGCKFPAVFWGRSPWMWSVWALGPPCLIRIPC